MLERRQQGEDLHVHHPGRRVGHCQRTVAEARETGQRVVVAGRRGALPGGRGLAANSPSCVLIFLKEVDAAGRRWEGGRGKPPLSRLSRRHRPAPEQAVGAGPPRAATDPETGCCSVANKRETGGGAMIKTVTATLIAAFGLLVFVAGAAAQAAPGFTELDSVSSTGVQGNLDSELPSVSADGRF